MAIYDFFLSRNNGPTVDNYVGHSGRLFYDPAERVLRISDGTTAGGEVFNGLVTVANTEPTANFQGQIWLDPETFELSVYHNGNFIPTIDTATSTKIGGVKLGPGVTTNGEGQIIIDSEGLDFSFGDLAATVGTYTDESEYAVLSTINTNEDMVLASNGTGSVCIVGELHVHATNGGLTATLESEPAFRIKADGQVRILVPDLDATEGAVAIVGSATGEFISPVNTGVMLHVTGNYSESGIASRIYNDSQNSFGAWVTRRFNGTVASPTAVLANEEIMRLSGTAHNGTTIPGTGNQRIVYVARGNQTTSNQGGAIELWATPINTTTIAKVATIDNADGITSTKFTGPLTGLVTHSIREAGTVSGGTVTLNMTTDDIVRCTFANAGMTVAFSNIIPGRTVTLLARKTDGGADTVNTGLTAQNMSTGDETVSVDGVSTVVLTYYSLGTTTADIYCSMNYRP
jgi:hypothetical protein